MKSYIRLQEELPMAIQLPLQRLTARHVGPDGIRVPQAGRFHEPGSDLKLPEVQENLLLNSYRRTSRWDRVHRYENEVVVSTIEDTVARVLFSTQLNVMGLYGKPMAKNSQLWTADSHLLLDGPSAGREELERAARVVAQGGTFRYRFQFPAMRVGLHEVYWQRPLVAYWDMEKGKVEILTNLLLGYFTAYLSDNLDLAQPVELWPRLRQRDPYLCALHGFEHLEEHYMHKTALNIFRVLDTCRRWGEPVSKSFVRQILRLPEHETLESWLATLPGRASNPKEGQKLQQEVERCLDPAVGQETYSAQPGVPPPAEKLHAITYNQMAARPFEEAWWNDICKLANGDYVNKENADCVHDPATLARLTHHHRDLERLGDFLLSRHLHAIAAAEMEEQPGRTHPRE